MSTTIEWTQRPGTKGETWNPTTGCNKVSQGCKNCYAQVMHRRLQAMGVKGYEHDFLAGARPQPHTLDRPLKWKKPRTVFVNSMSDLFHEAVPFSFILEVYAVASITPLHTYLVLTKRPERAAEFYEWLRVYVNAHDMGGFNGWFNGGMPNVWLGTSVENQKAADERIPYLLRCPAAVRFLSCEPLLGPVDLAPYLWWDHASRQGRDYGPDWVIAGGESGHGARPMHPDWARSLRDQCQVAGVPFFFKQWGAWIPSYHAGERAHEPANYRKEIGQRWAAAATCHYWPDGSQSVRVGKKAAGRLLDAVEHNAWPQHAADLVHA